MSDPSPSVFYKWSDNPLLTSTTLQPGDISLISRNGISYKADINSAITVPSNLALSNFPTGGVIGTASSTVDIYQKFTITQTTAGQTLTLPNPSGSGNNKIIYVENNPSSTTSFTIYGIILTAGSYATFIYDGIAYTTPSALLPTTTLSTNVSGQISALTEKATLIGADNALIEDSAASNVKKRTTFSDILSYISNGILASANTWAAAQRSIFTNLTYSSTITPNFALSNNYLVTLTGNATLANPTNLLAGQSGIINIFQDIIGSRTLAYGWGWQFNGGNVPLLSTAKLAFDQLSYIVNTYISQTVTITIATPAVITMTAHGLVSGQRVQLTTTGALPTGLIVSTTYWVTVIDANSYYLSTSLANAQAGTYIATSGTQSGVHNATCISINGFLNNNYI